MPLHWRILIGIILGLIFGLSINFVTNGQMDSGVLYGIKLLFGYLGQIFIRLLKMIVVPLVFASIYMAIVNLGNISEIGKIGKKTIGYYFLTTALAVIMGLMIVNIIQPGHIDSDTAAQLKEAMNIPMKVSSAKVGEKRSVEIIMDTLVGMIPSNPIEALARMNTLQIIFFSICMGLVAVSLPSKTKSFSKGIAAIDAIMQKGVAYLMKIAPILLFFLVGGIFMKIGFKALIPLLKYAITVIIGLFIHGFITLPLIVYAFTRKNPYRLLKQMMTPLLVGWATGSSVATLPLTMKTLEEEVKVNPKVSNFVLPLGATINMDGTALYESVAVIFIAGIIGYPLTAGAQVIIFITATLAAIGAAGIPSAGLVTMGVVLTAVGMPLDAIGVVLAVDLLLDKFRTSINVWGDGTAAFVIGELEKNNLDKKAV